MSDEHADLINTLRAYKDTNVDALLQLVQDGFKAVLTQQRQINDLSSSLPSWVNAAERSPDESTHVLAAFKNGDIEINWFEGGDWWGTDRGDEPTHWMPLPEAPKP